MDSSFGDSDGLDNDGILQINAFNASSATGTDYIHSIALDGVAISMPVEEQIALLVRLMLEVVMLSP